MKNNRDGDFTSSLKEKIPSDAAIISSASNKMTCYSFLRRMTEDKHQSISRSFDARRG
jgi:hypothetical protein